MDIERFKELMETTDSDLNSKVNSKVDSTLEGLKIVSKYTDMVIHGADHDILYSEDIDKLCENGITEEEVKQLAKYNFMIMDEYLACYV